MLWSHIISFAFIFFAAISAHAVQVAPQEGPAIKAAHCKYAFMSAPMCELEFTINPDGSPDSSVLVTMPGGKTHYESLTADKLGPNEMIHAWISKENPENIIEMFVYLTREKEGQSKMVNAKMPYAKIIWGDCAFTPR